MELMKDLVELLDALFVVHGHRCPGVPLGIRGGLLALSKLGVDRAKNKELFCIVEVGPAHAMHCFADGVQFATACTFGKGNIKKINHGKLAFTLIDKKSNRAVRIAVKPEFLTEKAFQGKFFNLRKSGVEPQDISPDITEPAIKGVLDASDEVLFNVSDIFTPSVEISSGTFDWIKCQICGEVVFGCGVRLKNGKYVCLPCSGYVE